MKPRPEGLRNPFVDPDVKPAWTHLSRIAGDRAAILFADLRRRVAVIEGLREELRYYGPEWGWAPRYCLGETTLFTAHIFPGYLAATVELDAPVREKMLASPKLATRIRNAIRDCPLHDGIARVRVELANRSAVRSLASLVLMKSKSVTSKRAE